MDFKKQTTPRKIDSRIFDSKTDFPTFVDLTPTLKNQSLQKNPTNTKPNQSPQLQAFKSEFTSKINILEKNQKKLLECLQTLAKDQNQKYQQLLDKIQAFQNHDEQVERLIEQQVLTLQDFQQKIRELQGIIEEQDMKLMNVQSALNAAHQHLEQLKK